MKLVVREITDTRCSFIVDGVKPDIVNALRRTLIADVPKMAIDEVEFHMGPIRDEEGNEYDSNSALFDEMIAHRLGMVPIPTDLQHFTFREQCECNGAGCPHCTIIYVMNKKGPCTVYSGDLQPLGDISLNIKEELIPIVKLKEKQALLIYATAILGRGKDHAKWQSVTICGYKNFPKITIKNDDCCFDPEDCVRSCPRKVFEVEKGKVIIKNLENCDLCMNCLDHCESSDGRGEPFIEVDEVTDKFIFTFETDGSITAKDALIYALKNLEDKYEELREQVSGLD
ncbi:MAG: DNA-directed RNA polymerase subunit D [Candidatus Thermoplasmatota archaeon]|nr:DNA-directed RNA polymerase subunit D [Candidatus Thermoplasmatota archaeon]